MVRLTSLLSLMLLCVTSIATGTDSENTTEQKTKNNTYEEKLEGVWRVVAGENQGTKVKSERLKGTTVVIDGNVMVTMDASEKELYRATYVLGSEDKPRQIDMTTQMGETEVVAMGIIQMEGDTLKLCYALPGGPRPHTFDTSDYVGSMMFKMKRANKVKQSERK